MFAGQPFWAAFNKRAEAPSSRPAGVSGTPPGRPEAAPGGRIADLPGQAESGAADDAREENAAGHISALDARLVKESFGVIEGRAQEAMEHFYAWLFVRHPEIRAMFPLAMSAQRERVFGALARIVWTLDSPAALCAYAGQLGRDHRKFGVKDKHYEAFFGALLATIRHFSAGAWTAGIQTAWETALGDVSQIMRAAATADAAQAPPWWVAEIVRHDQRGPDLAVLTIRPDQSLPYRPGQYLDVQVARWPRVWRSFSVANAPRASGLLDLHVRAVAGGIVSTALVHYAREGDTLLLGPARGEMTISGDCGRDLLCIAGGTGLAPIKALIEGQISAGQVGQAGPVGAARRAARRKISLYVGARTVGDLYDLRDLSRLAASCPALTVIPVVSQDPDWAGLSGLLPDAVRKHASCEGCEVFVSGPDVMVRETVRMLARRVSGEHIHHDPIAPAGGLPG
jgi:NAD(P)H-flavin reductase/hemoglobin-like flavoprotein